MKILILQSELNYEKKLIIKYPKIYLAYVYTIFRIMQEDLKLKSTITTQNLEIDYIYNFQIQKLFKFGDWNCLQRGILLCYLELHPIYIAFIWIFCKKVCHILLEDIYVWFSLNLNICANYNLLEYYPVQRDWCSWRFLRRVQTAEWYLGYIKKYFHIKALNLKYNSHRILINFLKKRPSLYVILILFHSLKSLELQWKSVFCFGV